MRNKIIILLFFTLSLFAAESPLASFSSAFEDIFFYSGKIVVLVILIFFIAKRIIDRKSERELEQIYREREQRREEQNYREAEAERELEQNLQEQTLEVLRVTSSNNDNHEEDKAEEKRNSVRKIILD